MIGYSKYFFEFSHSHFVSAENGCKFLKGNFLWIFNPTFKRFWDRARYISIRTFFMFIADR